MSMRKAESSVWNKTWSKNKGRQEFSSMDLKIFSEIKKVVSPRGKEIMELGCGRGALSCLMLQSGASKVYLVDFSEEALLLARLLFQRKLAHLLQIGENKRSGSIEFIQADILGLEETRKYDIVFSSGVAEHFSDQLREDIINKHLALSKDMVVIVVPARPHYNTIRHKRKRPIKRYGWQEAFSKMEMKALIEKNKGFELILNKRFYPLYSINLLELLGIDSNNFIAKCWNFGISAIDGLLSVTKIYDLIGKILSPVANYTGGLLIAVAVKGSTAGMKQRDGRR